MKDNNKLDQRGLEAAASAVRAERRNIDQKLALPAGYSQSIAPTNYVLLSAAIRRQIVEAGRGHLLTGGR